MTVRGFRYALEPVRLTRQWAVDGLAYELAAAKAELATQQCELGRLEELARSAQDAWNALGQGGISLPADHFVQFGRYLGDCRQRRAAQADEVTRAKQALDEVQQRLLAARRELDAVDAHRDEARKRFRQHCQDGEIKASDELWGVLKAGGESHDSNN